MKQSNFNTLRELVEHYVPLPPITTTTGWHEVLCKKCHDHGRKGLRAGFKFEDDSVAYHCFNCGAKPKHDPHQEKLSKISKNMSEVLTAFGVPEEELEKLSFDFFVEEKEGTQAVVEKKPPINLEPASLAFAPEMEVYRLTPEIIESDKVAEIAKYYLEDRNIDPFNYPFYLSNHKKWKYRVIIPIYKEEKLIFYQGRDLLDKRKKKYLNPPVPRNRVFYGYDQITKYNTDPLYIVEGFFDARVINGVACFCNVLSEEQIQILRQSPRPKVIVPDRQGDGDAMARQALELGWSVSLPDIGDCKDVSKAVQRFGRLYVLKSIAENTVSGLEAEVGLDLLCKSSTRGRK